MSKRSYRSFAVVAGAALALGSMAPALAARTSAEAEAEAEIDLGIITEVTGALPELPDVDLPSIGHLNSTILTVGTTGAILGGTVFAGTNTLLGTTFNGLEGVVSALPGECALVAVASCNDIDARIPVNASGLNVLGDGILNDVDASGLNVLGGGILNDVDARIPVNASGLNVLGGGILNDGGDLDVDVFAPVFAGVVAPVRAGVVAPVMTDVRNVLSGGLLGTGLGSILSVDGDASVVATVLAML